MSDPAVSAAIRAALDDSTSACRLWPEQDEGQDGVDMKIVPERLGDASATITWDICQHVTPGMQSDAAERVTTLIFRRPASR